MFNGSVIKDFSTCRQFESMKSYAVFIFIQTQHRFRSKKHLL